MQLFGFQITRKKNENRLPEEENKSFAPPAPEDGAVVVQSGSYYGTYVDLDGTVRNEVELITRYREMAMQPEIETAIDEIVNDAIITEDNGNSVELNTDELKQPEKIKKKLRDEFDNVLKLLNFGQQGHDIFRRWYIDGRLFYHVIIDNDRISEGIQELRYIDPRRIRKIRQIEKTKDQTGMEIIKSIQEYYLYNERGNIGIHSNMGVKISPDSIININSGLMDSRRAMVLSYLHKAIKPLNQLRLLEDAAVIYRLSRAPERRVFYIDVGNMPTIKAEQYLKDVMNKYRNKLVYDASTGEIRDTQKHMAMLEDFWLPRRGDSARGTEISTLPGGQALDQIADIEYFRKKLQQALGVPLGRLEPQQGFTLGRSTEITREELRFSKFINKLRSKFSTLFDDIMRIQVVLKNICTEEEWEEFKQEIWYDFLKDNNFEELKESELLMNRITTLQSVDPFVGRYYSENWVRKNILKQTDDDIKTINQEMEEEAKNSVPTDENGMPVQDQQIPQETEQPPQGAGLPEPITTPDQVQQEDEEIGPSKFEILENEIEFV